MLRCLAVHAALTLISVGSLLGQSAEATVFVDVNVVPMDGERVLPGRSVLVEGDRIVAVGLQDDLEVPAGARYVDGNGAYLMPGLADMHAHLDLDPAPEFMRLFLAEGTTTVRSLNSLP